jgi:hypothetical protein
MSFFSDHGWDDIGEEDGIAALGDGFEGGGEDDPGVAGDRFCDRQKQYSKSRFRAQNREIVKANDWIGAKKNLRKGSWWTTNQNVRSAERGSTQAKMKPWRPPHTRSQPPTRQRNFVPIYVPGVTLGTSRKTQEELRKVIDNSELLRRL